MSNVYTYWSMNWVALIAMAVLCFVYSGYHNFHAGSWIKPFAAAILLLVVCFFSPLHILSNEYLFSAHMTVHVLLLLVAGPLLVIGLRKDSNTNRSIESLSKLMLRKPVAGWLAGVGIMWFWHLPFIFNAGMQAEHTSPVLAFVLSTLESTSLLAAGMLFSWPLVSPLKEFRLPALNGVAYLFTACIGCSLLGLLITFAPAGIFRHFLSSTDVYGFNEVILNRWQINQAMDQQIAGLIMWVPCCLLYVVYALYLLISWFNEKEIVNNRVEAS